MNLLRSLHVVLFGTAPDLAALKALISAMNGVARIHYAGAEEARSVALELGCMAAPTCASQAQALACLRQAQHQDDTLLVALDSLWPQQGLQRFCDAAAHIDADVISPLGTEDEFNPLPEALESALSAQELDNLCYLLADPTVLPVGCTSTQVSLWRARAWRALAATPSLRIEEAPLARSMLATLYIGSAHSAPNGPQAPEDQRDAKPASALNALRLRIGLTPARIPIDPQLLQQPTTLHVLHGWGGGVARFVCDLAEGDSTQMHLALCSQGHFSRRSYGEARSLYLVSGGEMHFLRHWPLPVTISDSIDSEPSSHELMQHLLSRYKVQRLLISSLIGHSFDALRTGIPTLYVCHDYYPLWPILHCDFGDPSLSFDQAHLDQALPKADTRVMPFAKHSSDYWWRLRQQFIATLLAQNITLCAPSESLRRNWLRIAPELKALRFETIAHGFKPFETMPTPHPIESDDQISAAPRRLRLLILGRIQGGKAAQLLAAALPQLTEHAELFLIGCGDSGHELFGQSGVHILLDYQRSELPQLIARINPDAALLPATVAESFSYTLSELWALGIVPIASAIGSFVDRIDDGNTGILFAPKAEALLACVRELQSNREPLNRVRAQISQIALRTMAEARADYAALWSTLATPKSLPAHIETTDVIAYETSAWAESNLRMQMIVAAQQQALSAQTQELQARADWGHALDRLQQRTEKTARELQTALDERCACADRLVVEIADLRAELQSAADRGQQAADSYQQLDQAKRDADRGWAAEVQRLNNEVNALHTSTSWKLTRPVRVIARIMRSLRARSSYWWARLRGAPPRLLRSLRTRGIAGTWRRFHQDAGETPNRPLAIELSVALPAVGDAFEAFALPLADEPTASIVIPVYNKFPYTLACLQSIAKHGAKVGFEVIVVDDCSSDETRAGLARIDGIRVLHNAQNLGFIGACNAGAAAARGRYLVFLNNDTQVTEHWLDALLDTFDQHAKVGLVGAKLVYPDGRLQEAGGIVFSDASGWNYGRFGDPADPAFNYVREVDYCSGAAIAISRDLFEQRGGFDTRYTPAYYEDTDLAFQVREAGLRVLYQPASVVIHFEGITSGTDVASGTKRYQVINQQKFAERWAHALQRQPRSGAPIELAREHRAVGRMLIVDATVPEPDKDSGSVRMVNILRALVALGWKVSFTSENRSYVAGYTEALQALGVETLHSPWIGEPSVWMREQGALWDVVMLSRHYVASPLLPLVRHYAPRARIFFDTVDLHYLREEREAALQDRSDLRRTAAITKLAELRLVKACDLTLVVSPVEQELLQHECPQSRIAVLSNVHEVMGRKRDFAERKDLYFVGGFQHQPNIDAVQWFVAEVWPLIAPRLPEARFHIVGSRMPDAIRALQSERVLATGFVPTLDAHLDGCRLSVAPLRYGAGVKGKINQSMAHGQPVVATTLAAEGMFLQPDVDVLVADTPSDFADAVVRLYEDEALWLRLSDGGLANVERHFSFDAAKQVLAGILER